MTTEAGSRAAAIEALVASLNAGLDEDEAAAKVAANVAGPDWAWKTKYNDDGPTDYVTSPDGTVLLDTLGGIESEAPHVARQDPARALREVAAKRALIAAAVAQPHEYTDGDAWYSCSQAVDPHADPGDDDGPGSGCLDDGRAGKPCDCGRDARVERLLRILAGIYEDGET